MKPEERKKISPSVWVRMSIMLVIYIALCIWIGPSWLWLGVPLIIDAYTTKKIPWRWWQKSKKAWVRKSMKAVEDVVVVLIIVQMVFVLFFQNFRIPTSSLEKSYLVGDYLFVSKLAYGPRLPMTPLAMPLLHHSFPWGGKAYLAEPQLPYKRLAGLGKVKRNDIVVFNFPTGDTVPVKVQVPDYYTLKHLYGRERIWADPQTFGEIVYRPVDKREHYVKRCIGMPGDSLEIRDNQVYINGKLLPQPEKMQLNYFVQTSGFSFTPKVMDALSLAKEDLTLLSSGGQDYSPLYQYLKLKPLPTDSSSYGAVYQLPLTLEAKKKLQSLPGVIAIVTEPSPEPKDEATFPLEMQTGWTRDNYGPLLIPAKGMTVKISPQNLPLYERCIRNYEGHELVVKDAKVYVDGKATDTYTFQMDYYFMLGDNRHRSADSRYWGYVPEDHIVGKPVFVWLSVNKDKGWFKGKIRKDRILLPASKIH